MGILVYVLGRSGTGKSFSMRNFKKGDLGVVNVQGKILPFKGSGAWDIVNTDDHNDIVNHIEKMSKKYKSIVVDDFQYVMANEFMRRATERGYDKFTEIARHAWDIADKVRELPNDVIVYVMCHTDTDQDGFEKLKTIGKLLDEKIVLEGMSTIILKTAVSDGQYMFLTQNNGHDTVKSPAGMFPSYAIDNDLKYVDEKIRNYYEIGEFMSDEEIAEIDEAVKHDDVAIKEEKKKRVSRRGKAKEEEPTEASKEDEEKETTEEAGESAEKPRRSRRSKEEDNEEPSETSDSQSDGGEKPKRRRRSTVKEENEAAVKEARSEYVEKASEAIEEAAGEKEEVPIEDVDLPEAELPKRKRRTRKTEESVEEAEEEPKEEASTPTRRRRRRSN